MPLFYSIKSTLAHLDQVFFRKVQQPFIQKTLNFCLLSLIYIAGIFHWNYFFNSGNITFKAYDWKQEITYYSILKNALSENIIPYFVNGSFHGTNHFLAIPEINLSPQIFFLNYLSIGQFVLFQILLLYSLGFIGCLLIKRKYHLSIFSFLFMFLIFNFNGHITSHLSVGHSMWSGYFLLPFLFYCIFQLLEDKSYRNFSFKCALVLFFIFLQGSFHIFMWCIIFLILIALFNRQLIKVISWTLLWSLLLNLYRIVPAVISLKDKKQIYFSGYPTMRDMFDGLTVIHMHYFNNRGQPGGLFGAVNWWELDIYIGLIGFCAVVYFGIISRMPTKLKISQYTFKALDFPLLVLAFFSLNSFYAPIAKLPLPFVGVERIPSRFLIIPLLGLLFISTLRISSLIERSKKHSYKFLSLILLTQLWMSLLTHLKYWRITLIEKSFPAHSAVIPSIIENTSDTFYMNCFNLSLTMSLLTLCYCAYSLINSKLKLAS